MSSYKIKPLTNKEIKQTVTILEKYVENAAELLPKKGKTARYSLSESESGIVVDKSNVIAIEKSGHVFPSLKIVRKVKMKIPIIKVDIGAIRFVVKGADIMRPGITHIDEKVNEGDLVLVIEEQKGSPLSFGIAMYDYVDMKVMKTGKCVKNLHHLKDAWWQFPI